MSAIEPIAADRRDLRLGGRRDYRRSRAARALVVSLGLTSWASAAAAMDPAPGAALLPETTTPPSRHVVFETTKRTAWLERNEPMWFDDGLHLVWRPICASPCSMDVPSTGLYRVSGPGVRSSSKFRLPDDPNPIRVNARPGSSDGWGWGLAGVIVGATFMLPAIILLADTASCDEVAMPDCKASRRLGGFTALTMGVVLGFGGLYLLLSNRTDVSLAQAPRPFGRATSFLGLKFSQEGVVF